MEPSVGRVTGARIEISAAPAGLRVRDLSSGLVVREVRLVSVTVSQKRVLDQLVLDGPTDRVIARRLGVEEETVKSHMKALLTRLRVRNRTAAVCEVLSGRVVVDVRAYSRRSADGGGHDDDGA